MYCSLADVKDGVKERTKEILEAHQSLEEFQSVKGKVETEKKLRTRTYRMKGNELR